MLQDGERVSEGEFARRHRDFEICIDGGTSRADNVSVVQEVVTSIIDLYELRLCTIQSSLLYNRQAESRKCSNSFHCKVKSVVVE